MLSNVQISELNYHSEISKSVTNHLNDLTKPVGSLGRLEEFVLQYNLCHNKVNAVCEDLQVYTFASDHGITNQQVCPYPKEVTYQMVMNMLAGGAAVSVLAKNSDIKSYVVDMGVDGVFKDHQLLIKKKIASGTKDFSVEPAMTLLQCEEAIQAGFDIAINSGADLLGIGEMGIGNTSSAAALYSLVLGVDSFKTVGAGTGSTGALLERKKLVIKDSVAMYSSKWENNPLFALRFVGGFEIAGMVGMILGGASKGIPVVVDGFISGAASLIATCLNSAVQNYLFYSHISAEKFHKEYIDSINIKPILDLSMRLGEGTGAVLAMQIIKQAMKCYHEMATFSGANISKAAT
jgi:nicotinate-nucleotide--dimethylbenzimidazole phosphoribosyltransferase